MVGVRRISFARATVRYLGKIVSVGTFLLGFLIALGSKWSQALHDLLEKTIVIDAQVYSCPESEQDG
jgi:uncharacterized RDD family membrane protein YckC